MDALIELLPLLFVGAYYLLAGRRRARLKREAAQRQALQESGDGSQEQAPTPFQAFLEQMEEAMAEAGAVAAEADKPIAQATPDPIETPRLDPIPSLSAPPFEAREFVTVPGSFDSPSPVDHEAHGFGDMNPLSEEAFERAPAFTTRRRRPAGDYDPHQLRRTTQTTQDKWRRRLRDPDAALDAFVLQTIFGPRGGRHGR